MFSCSSVEMKKSFLWRFKLASVCDGTTQDSVMVRGRTRRLSGGRISQRPHTFQRLHLHVWFNIIFCTVLCTLGARLHLLHEKKKSKKQPKQSFLQRLWCKSIFFLQCKKKNTMRSNTSTQVSYCTQELGKRRSWLHPANKK